jgi:acyl carrier protein
LPGELVPHLFVELGALPLDSSGKVDDTKLASPFAAAKQAYVPPRSDAERLLARLYAEALGVERVSVHDNFFDLGGQSLLCLRVIDRIERETGTRISPRVLLLNTVEQAASVLAQKDAAAPPEPPSRAPGAAVADVAGRVLKGLRGLLGG